MLSFSCTEPTLAVFLCFCDTALQTLQFEFDGLFSPLSAHQRFAVLFLIHAGTTSLWYMTVYNRHYNRPELKGHTFICKYPLQYLSTLISHPVTEWREHVHMCSSNPPTKQTPPAEMTAYIFGWLTHWVSPWPADRLLSKMQEILIEISRLTK